MGWLEILLLIAFLVFPLLQQLLEKRGGSTTLPSPPEEEAEEAWRQERRGRQPERAERPVAWEEWTAERAEVLAEEGVTDDERARELSTLQESLPEEALSEAARVSSPVVSLESLHVDRTAEHGRFHRTLRKAPVVVRVPVEPPLSPARALRNRGALRRAVLMAEILGPPRGLQ